MLRFHVRMTSPAAGVAAFTVSHGICNQAVALGVSVPLVADFAWNIVPWGAGGGVGAGRTFVTAVGSNRITLRNTVNSQCSIDVWVWAFEGRRY